MPTIVLMVLVRGILAIVAVVRKRARPATAKPVCIGCEFAHIQYGACGRRSISCSFGGGVRPIALDVLYCTDYGPRYKPMAPRNRISFGQKQEHDDGASREPPSKPKNSLGGPEVRAAFFSRTSDK